MVPLAAQEREMIYGAFPRDFLYDIFEETYKEGIILEVILLFPVLPEVILQSLVFLYFCFKW